ncbi:TPA: hypothetical protein OOF41_002584 [Citrobacter freundii]|nr:hypothetical protein [Citrobacter freundii]
MSKRKSKIYENPGLDSTIFVEPQQIANTANAFREVVNSLNNGYLDVHDVRRNVLYTNATLAIELYFKAFLVKRIPAPYDFTIENGQATKAEFDDEKRVTNWHSRLDLLEEHKTHNLKKLFNALSDTQKKCVTQEILQTCNTIQTATDLLQFLDTIRNYFVDKRYEFQEFIYGVPKDSNIIYTLIPVLNAIGKVLANPPNAPFPDMNLL